MDLTITVSGVANLEDGLKAMYRDIEMLDGKNQYKCSGCQKLVDASKVTIYMENYSIVIETFSKALSKLMISDGIVLCRLEITVGKGQNSSYKLFLFLTFF